MRGAQQILRRVFDELRVAEVLDESSSFRVRTEKRKVSLRGVKILIFPLLSPARVSACSCTPSLIRDEANLPFRSCKSRRAAAQMLRPRIFRASRRPEHKVASRAVHWGTGWGTDTQERAEIVEKTIY